jgi:hypothetical protein
MSKKRFLTIFFSVLFILLGVVGLFLYEYVRIRPNNVHFTNVTSSSVTVSWNTEKAIPASVRVFEGDRVIPFSIYHNNDRFFDTRDVKEAELLAVQQTSDNIVENEDLTVSVDDFQTDVVVTDMGEYYTHHVTVTGLDPETEYSFMVGDEYLFREVEDVNGNAVVSTLQIPEEIKSPFPAYGSVKDANNQENIPIDELSPVTDAVIYFNYLDEFTGERSSVYSSSFNSDGNWYIDVSNAVGEDGRFFLERYKDTITNILVELVIDAGPLGQWKKVVDFDFISPTDLIVINDPLMFNDEEIGISRVDSQVLDSVVKGVNAELPCKFANFCGPCYRSSLADQCPCPEATLKTRGCEGESTDSLQEAAEEAAKEISTSTGCSGNASPGDYVQFGEDCKKCQLYKCRDSHGNLVGCDDPDASVLEYRWVSIGDKSHPKCAGSDQPSGAVIPGDGDDGPGAVADTPISKMNAKTVGDKCWVNGVVGTIQQTDQFEWRCVPPSEGPYGPGVVDEKFYIVGGKCRSLSYLLNLSVSSDFLGALGGPYNTEEDCEDALEEEDDGPGVVNEKFYIEGNKCKSIDLSNPNLGTAGFYNIGTLYNTEDECEEALLKATEPPEDENNGSGYGDGCWKSASGGYYYIDSEGNAKRCKNNGEWSDNPSNQSSQFAIQLYDILKNSGVEIETVTIAPCNNIGDFVTVEISKGEYKDYYCDEDDNGNHVWVEWKEYQREHKQIDIPAGRTTSISPGDPCKIGRCECNDEIIYSGDVCPELSPGECSPETLGWICGVNGEVCRKMFSDIQKTYDSIEGAKGYYASKKTGTVCVFNDEVNECYSGLEGLRLVPASNSPYGTSSKYIGCGLDENGRSSKTVDYRDTQTIGEKLSPQVLGEETTKSSYIIDQKTGLISSIEQGSYLIEYQGEYYSFDVVNDISSGNSISIYLDENSNGVFDEGTDVKVSDVASEIDIIALKQRYDYELIEGLNFISLPFLISGEDYRTAAGLLTKLNEVYDDAFYSISKFDGRWKIVGQNVEVYDNNDFQLLPGEGYMIKAKRDVDISIVGQPVQLETEEDKSPIYMTQGWNLIGLYGTGIKSYTAKTLIEDINKDNFTADNVTKWASDKQMYEGFQISDGEEYGFDYPLNILESYFVRIIEGKGNWQPSLSGNN